MPVANSSTRVFFDELGILEPDIYLGVGSGTHAEQTARVMLAFEPVAREQRPDLVLVVGDVNSTLACTLTAIKMYVPVAHVEAGLRSFDRTMPEEVNRVVTDALAEWLFITERSANENLLREGRPRDIINLGKPPAMPGRHAKFDDSGNGKVELPVLMLA